MSGLVDDEVSKIEVEAERKEADGAPNPSRGPLDAPWPPLHDRRLGCLGCFAYTLSPGGRTAAGRMFAPAIGVDEDIVNVNSAGCLAAYLLETGRPGAVDVHQGDALGRTSAVFAEATRNPNGIAASIGRFARILDDE